MALAAGLEGYFIRSGRWWERVLFIGAAFMLIKPGLYTDLIGLGLLVLALGLQRLRPQSAVAVAVGSPS